MAETHTEINVQRDWDFDINLSGLVAPTGKGGNVLPTGYYKVKLTDLYVNPERNANRVIIKCQVSEGPFTGAVRTTGFNKPTSNDDKVRYYWRGLSESVGYSPAQLDAGSISVGIKTFKDREAHILFTAKDESPGPDGKARAKFEDIDFLSPSEWSQQKQNLQMTGGAAKAATPSASAGSALGTTTMATPAKIEEPTALGSGSSGNELGGTKKSALLTQLGVN